MNVSEVDASSTRWPERPPQQAQPMSDNRRRDRARREALPQGSPGDLPGRGVRPGPPPGRAAQGDGGRQAPPTASQHAQGPRWAQARAPRHPCAPMARPRAPRGGGGLGPVGRPLPDALRLRDAGGGQGGPGRRPGWQGAEAPRGRDGARLAPGVARAPPAHRAWARGAPPRGRRAEEPAEPRGACWATARAMGRSDRAPGPRGGGPRGAAPPCAPRRQGTARRVAGRPWGRVGRQAACARARRSMGHARRRGPAWGGMVGPKGIKSRGRGAARWPQRKRPVAWINRAVTSRPCAQIRPVEAALGIRRLSPMSSASPGCASPRGERISGWAREAPEVQKSHGARGGIGVHAVRSVDASWG